MTGYSKRDPNNVPDEINLHMYKKLFGEPAELPDIPWKELGQMLTDIPAGYYLLTDPSANRITPVEVYVIKYNAQDNYYVRGLHIACSLRRAVEKGYTFERLVRQDTAL